jgi:NTE family protein
MLHGKSSLYCRPGRYSEDGESTINSWLPARAWPKQGIQLVAVDADRGERHVFEATSGVRLIDAVAASGALAGVYPAVTINQRRYIDGGFYSTDNCDLAIGFDRVLILTLQAGDPPLCVVPLEAAVDQLRSAGTRVEVVHPDDATKAAFASVGGNILDPAVRGSAARAGRAQGRTHAATVAAFWQLQSGEIHERTAAPF